MKIKPIIFLVLLLISSIAIINFPMVKAVTPTLVQSSNGTGATSATCALSSQVAQGDFILVIFSVSYFTSSGGSDTGAYPSISDTIGNIYQNFENGTVLPDTVIGIAPFANVDGGGQVIGANGGYMTLNKQTSTSNTITVIGTPLSGLTTPPSPSQVIVSCYDFNNVNSFKLNVDSSQSGLDSGTEFNSATTTVNMNTLNTISPSVNDFVFELGSAYYCNGQSSFTKTSGFTTGQILTYATGELCNAGVNFTFKLNSAYVIGWNNGNTNCPVTFVANSVLVNPNPSSPSIACFSLTFNQSPTSNIKIQNNFVNSNPSINPSWEYTQNSKIVKAYQVGTASRIILPDSNTWLYPLINSPGDSTNYQHSSTPITYGLTGYYPMQDASTCGNSVTCNTYNLSGNNQTGTINQYPNEAAYWNFDNATGTCIGKVIDITGNGNNLTCTNSPKFISGKFNNALNFTSASTEFTSAGNKLDQTTNSFSITSWVNPRTLTGCNNCPVIAKGFVSGEQGYGMRIENGIGKLTCYAEGAVTNIFISPLIDLTANNWEFTACIYSWSGTTLTLTAYIGTTSRSTSGIVGSLTNAHNFDIGTDDAGEYMSGGIDDSRFITMALTSSQESVIANSSPFSSTLNSNINCRSTSCIGLNVGTNVGNGAYISIPDSTSNRIEITNSFTWAISFYSQNILDTLATPTLVSKASVSGNYDLLIFDQNPTSSNLGELELSLIDSAGVGHNMFSNTIFQYNTQYNVIAGYNGKNMFIYVNGNLDNKLSTVFTLDSTVGNNLYIGCAPSLVRTGNWYLSDFRTYNRMLYSGEIQQLNTVSVPQLEYNSNSGNSFTAIYYNTIFNSYIASVQKPQLWDNSPHLIPVVSNYFAVSQTQYILTNNSLGSFSVDIWTDYQSSVSMPQYIAYPAANGVGLWYANPNSFNNVINSFGYQLPTTSIGYAIVYINNASRIITFSGFRATEAFNFIAGINLKNSVINAIKLFESFTLSDIFINQLEHGIILTEKFLFNELACLIAQSCSLNIPFYNGSTEFISNDGNGTDWLISQIILPIVVIFAVIIVVRRYANMDENTILPIILFVILMIGWAGQGLIFPGWVSLLIILICSGGLAYSIGNYFFGNRGISSNE